MDNLTNRDLATILDCLRAHRNQTAKSYVIFLKSETEKISFNRDKEVSLDFIRILEDLNGLNTLIEKIDAELQKRTR